MSEKRITEITLETEATLTIRWRAGLSHSGEIPCPRCGSRTAVFAAHEAAAVRAGLRELVGDAGLEQIHFARTETGSHLVCLESLRQAVPQATRRSILQIKQDQP